VLHLLRAALFHHVADLVLDGLHTVLTNHVANLVLHGLHTLLRNHMADFVLHLLRAALFHHMTHLVANRLGAGLRNHVADSVVHLLLAWLTYPVACRVRNLLRAAFAFIADAVHDFPLHFRNPNVLANAARRALCLDHVAFTRNIPAAAAATVILPATRLLHALPHDWPGAFGHLGFPMSAAHLDRLLVVDRLADRVVHRAVASLVDRLANGVA